MRLKKKETLFLKKTHRRENCGKRKAVAIFVERERMRELINAMFRVVDSVARFLYKIYNCVQLITCFKHQKGPTGRSAIDTGAYQCAPANSRGDYS